MRARLTSLLLCCLLALAGCGLISPAAAPTEIPPTATEFQPPTQVVPLPSATPTLEPTPSPVPFTPFGAMTTVDYVNLRSNPGYLFSVLKTVNKGTSLTVLGKSPGEDWIYLQTPDQTRGWILRALLVSPGHDFLAPPVVQPENVLMVSGRLVDTTGTPVNGIQFAISQGQGDSLTRTDALTNIRGEFYAFFPTDLEGEWEIAYTAISCSSRVMDAKCNCVNNICGTVNPAETKITLPQAELLTFTWQ